MAISPEVSASRASLLGATRLIIVIQNTRQLRMQKTAISFTRRSAVRSRACSARQPDFRILWNTSIFQRSAYQRSQGVHNVEVRDSKGRVGAASVALRYRRIRVLPP